MLRLTAAEMIKSDYIPGTPFLIWIEYLTQAWICNKIRINTVWNNLFDDNKFLNSGTVEV